MKKTVFFLSVLLTALCLCGCQNQPEQEEIVEKSEGKGVLKGKAFYSNSSDSSTIYIVLDKTDGLLTDPIINALDQNRIVSNPKESSRTVVAYHNCNTDGSYEFSNLEEGLYTVYAVSADSTEKAVFRNISVKNEEDNEVPELILTATGSISGKITLDNSADNNTGFVIFAAGTSYMATTAADGTFLISGLPAGTDYQIVVMKGNYIYLWKCLVQAVAFEDTSIGEINFERSEIEESAKPGTDGKDGTPIIWKGAFTGDFESALRNPEYLWAYYNIGDGCSYIYDGNKWTLLASAGSNGTNARISIMYELNGGVLPKNAPLTYTSGKNIKLVAPEKSGYYFMGFYLDEDFSGDPVSMLNNYVVGQILYARWGTKYEYDIMLLNQSGEISVSGNVSKSDLDNLIHILSQKYLSNPEIKISLDFSDLISIEVENNQNFNDCYNVEEIKVSAALISNYRSLFQKCKSVKHVIICDGVEEIPDSAFSNCNYIISMVIPESVRSIGSSAFYNCNKMTDIYNLSDQSVYQSNLVAVHTSLDEPPIVRITDDGFMFVKGRNDNQFYLMGYNGFETEIVLPDSVEFDENTVITEYKIASSAFAYCNDLTKITIPFGVTEIGSDAFYNCTNLTSVVMPSTVTIIGSSAFESCSKLASVIMPPSVTSIGSRAFGWCSSLESITIPDGITCIYNYTFQCCGRLTKIVIPDTVTMIGDYAFGSCSNLLSVVIPASVTTISNDAFSNCTKLFDVYNLSNLNFVVGSTDYGRVAYYAKAIHTSLNDSSIIYTTEDGFSFIKENNQYYLINYAKANVTEDIILPDYFELDSNTKITEYGIYNNAFSGCSNIVSMTLPSCVKTIGDYAFNNCTKMKNITIPANSKLISIGQRAFYNCSKLRSITLPSGLTGIGDYAFMNCSGLKEIFNLTSTNLSTGSINWGYVAKYSIVIHTSINDASIFYKTKEGYELIKENNGFYLLDYIGMEKEIVLLDYLELNDNTIIKGYGIKIGAFRNDIRSITIPVSVKSIESKVFNSFSNLKSIKMSGIWKYANDKNESIINASSYTESELAILLRNTLSNYTWTRIE